MSVIDMFHQKSASQCGNSAIGYCRLVDPGVTPPKCPKLIGACSKVNRPPGSGSEAYILLELGL